MHVNFNPTELCLVGDEVCFEVGRSIDLLNKIETTVQYLTRLSGRAQKDTDFLLSSVEVLSKSGTSSEIDPDGTTIGNLTKARECLSSLYSVLMQRREFAKTAPELDDGDGVVDAYDEAISSIARLHNAFNSLASVIAENDADLQQPSGKSYSDIDKLFLDLGI